MNKILRIACVLLMLGSPGLYASTSCISTVVGRLCTAQVDMAQFYEEAAQSQYQSQWCWAASISMLFSAYGHPVDQGRIVYEVYGSDADMPTTGYVMATQLNKGWTDNSGNNFLASVEGLYDGLYGINLLDNNTIVNSLDNGEPLIIGVTNSLGGGHAVVLTEVQYNPTIFGPSIVEGRAYDPWPGIGERALSHAELTTVGNGGSLFFAAAINVSDSANSNGQDSGGAGSIGTELLLLAILLLTLKRYYMNRSDNVFLDLKNGESRAQ